MRNLTKTLAVISLLAPVSAQPLGIGDLRLHSALNQRLNAEIDLLLSSGENPNDIQVRLAPPEKFDEAGITWNYFLPKIKFDTVVLPNGSVVVKLSSNEVLQEPFLDFLVEVSWTKGNLYREFTVLVDPPAVYEQPVVPVVEQKAAPAQVEEPSAPVTEPIASEVVETAATAGAMRVDEYGPTHRTDTLWSIAEKVKPSKDVSTEQMVMAIFEANPRAFYQNNVNALMSGGMLDIPDNEAVIKLSRSQAARLFRQQNQAWNAPVEKPAAKPSVPEEEQPSSSQLELVAPVETEVAEQAVVSPEQEQAGEQTAETEQAETKEIAEAGEQQVTSEQGDMEAMQARLQKLEQQLEMMQKLLVLKDEQLAALQNKQLLDQQAAAQTPVQAQPETGAVKPVQQPPAPVQPKPVPVQVHEPEPGFMEENYYTVVGGLGTGILGVLGWLWWRNRKLEEQSETESMFASSSEIRMPDSETTAMPVDDISSYDVGTVGESSFLSEFTPSDFDAFDSEQNEVDPISEADVYLAYGRYQQAEELMRQAIADEPEREDCKLKLLEIFYANENKEAFENYARELAQAGMQNNHSFWSKVLEMGNEIIPGSAVLSSSEAAKAEFSVDTDDDGTLDQVEEEKSEETDLDIDRDEESFDLDSFDKQLADDEFLEQDIESEEKNNQEIDFDLSMFEEPESKEEAKQGGGEKEEDLSVADDLESIEFNFNMEPDQEAKEVAALEPEPELSHETDDELEHFDFSDIGESQKQINEVTDENLADRDEEEFDFNFDFDDESLSGNEEGQEGVTDLTDMDEFETKIDLARAYIDMGDMDAARSIAEEVREKGSEQQKGDAQAILDQLT